MIGDIISVLLSRRFDVSKIIIKEKCVVSQCEYKSVRGIYHEVTHHVMHRARA